MPDILGVEGRVYNRAFNIA